MSRSLSWIDGEELASSLTRAGVSSLPGEALSRVRFPTSRPAAEPRAGEGERPAEANRRRAAASAAPSGRTAEGDEDLSSISRRAPLGSENDVRRATFSEHGDRRAAEQRPRADHQARVGGSAASEPRPTAVGDADFEARRTAAEASFESRRIRTSAEADARRTNIGAEPDSRRTNIGAEADARRTNIEADARRTPFGADTDPRRTNIGAEPDSRRTKIGAEADARRTPFGADTDPRQTIIGAEVDSRRTDESRRAPVGAPSSEARRTPVGAESERAPALPPSPALDELAVSARVAALETWLKAAVGPRYYVADPQGLPIAAAPQVKDLVVSSVALERAIRSLRGITGTPSPGGVAIALDDQRTLETLWCDTKIGRVAIGILGAEPIPKSTAKLLRDNVVRTFDWKES